MNQLLKFAAIIAILWAVLLIVAVGYRNLRDAENGRLLRAAFSTRLGALEEDADTFLAQKASFEAVKRCVAAEQDRALFFNRLLLVSAGVLTVVGVVCLAGRFPFRQAHTCSQGIPSNIAE